ncbi:CDP-archaeol synthase [Clostridiaceae bacterium HFYG-1003]|nr:CDP-archaeol synthase [Clostridiaceae bacterium HFYG-1003]
MLNRLGEIYVTLAPAILAGVLNMIWVRLPWALSLAIPMDRGIIRSDGYRLLGDHKTWKGFLGMIGLGALSALFWGGLLPSLGLEQSNLLYRIRSNTPEWNLITGGLLGLGYALAELPNSWLKRRLGITPGKAPAGSWKWFFVFWDQADSVLGILIVLRFFWPIAGGIFVLALLAGSLTHLLLNMLLYLLKLRKNMF